MASPLFITWRKSCESCIPYTLMKNKEDVKPSAMSVRQMRKLDHTRAKESEVQSDKASKTTTTPSPSDHRP